MGTRATWAGAGLSRRELGGNVPDETERAGMNHDATIRASLKSQIVKVICTEYSAGEGTKENPARTVLVWHTLEGSFIGRRDSGYSEHEECKLKDSENEQTYMTALASLLAQQKARYAKIIRGYKITASRVPDSVFEELAQEIERDATQQQ